MQPHPTRTARQPVADRPEATSDAAILLAAGRVARVVAVPALAAALALAVAVPVLAHGTQALLAPDALTFLLGWSGEPLIWLPVIVLALLWRYGAGRVRRAHPGNPIPARRTRAWMLGLGVILLALDSGIERYDTTLFAVHMVQHLLLTLVAPPLLLYAGPITLILRAVPPSFRRRWILPILHARLLRLLAFPVVAWVLFAGVMWGSHFSPLFDASLENVWIHRLEHGLFIGAALLFWWPVVGPDPSPWRLPPAARVMYVGLQMPQNTFLAVAITMVTTPLYAHYATNVRTWGPTPLEDQQLAGSLMWLVGDLVFLAAVILLVLAWMRDDERRAPAVDRRVDVERAAIRKREVRLAARRAAERVGDGTSPDGSAGVGGSTAGAPPAEGVRGA